MLCCKKSDVTGKCCFYTGYKICSISAKLNHYVEFPVSFITQIGIHFLKGHCQVGLWSVLGETLSLVGLTHPDWNCVVHAYEFLHQKDRLFIWHVFLNHVFMKPEASGPIKFGADIFLKISCIVIVTSCLGRGSCSPGSFTPFWSSCLSTKLLYRMSLVLTFYFSKKKSPLSPYIIFIIIFSGVHTPEHVRWRTKR